MTLRYFLSPYFAALCLLPSGGFAREPADAPRGEFRASDVLSMVPPSAPGVYTEEKKGASGYRLILRGRHFSSRDEIEKYLVYRAAELAKMHKALWFTLTEARSSEDPVAGPKPDPSSESSRSSAASDRSLAFLVPMPDRASKPYAFRLEFWRPVWRFKLAGESAWKSWSPFSGAPFLAEGLDFKSITDFEVTADIVLHKGPMDYYNPLAFEAWAVSDFLMNQILPPT